jgi:chaperonin GroES
MTDADFNVAGQVATSIEHLLITIHNRMSDKSPITPLGDRVIVRPLTEEELGTVSKSGIIIPETAKKEKPEQGVVIAVGAGKWNEDADKRVAMDVKEGDRVVFSKYGYDEVKVEDHEYFIVSESSILGIFNK